ncbi:MAG: DUF1028 domain-containing protein [Actinomycetota bacterium]|nr:DUF1028 domain-containing protein [Actinomycetota bacterium]
MTFSIVARSADGLTWGVAVASKFLSVGAFVPAASPSAGALATQADVNLTYRPRGLALLADGAGAHESVRRLVDADDRASHRQLGVVDRHGEAAAHTGGDCIGWAGHRTEQGVSVQGNCLIGAEVVEQMLASWRSSASRPHLGDRLVAALSAGDLAGGDARGRQSAAVLVVRDKGGFMEMSDVVADLRVDDHPAPTDELGRLMGLHHLYLERPDEADLVPLGPALRTECDMLAARCGHRDLEEWVGTHNYEMRMVDDRIDAAVVDLLRAQARAI